MKWTRIFISIALIFCMLWFAQIIHSAEPVVVIINVDAAPAAVLPSLETINSKHERVVSEFRAAGLRVATDPSGRCIAVTAPPMITDNDLLAGKMPVFALATGISERVTPRQLAVRDHGYLREGFRLCGP